VKIEDASGSCVKFIYKGAQSERADQGDKAHK